MKVLITGGLGKCGSALLNIPHEKVFLDRLDCPEAFRDQQFVQGDVGDDRSSDFASEHPFVRVAVSEREKHVLDSLRHGKIALRSLGFWFVYVGPMDSSANTQHPIAYI